MLSLSMQCCLQEDGRLTCPMHLHLVSSEPVPPRLLRAEATDNMEGRYPPYQVRLRQLAALCSS